MTPLERAARALCALDGNPENATMEGKPLWQSYLPEARAVLWAIREPSVVMVGRGGANMDSDGATMSDELEERALTCWSTMIDAALEEG